MAGLSACGVMYYPVGVYYTERHDISTSDDIAIIAGSKEGVVNRRRCQIVEPAATMELITDAGKVSLVVGCHYVNAIDGPSPFVFAGIKFDAEAGHLYRLGMESHDAKCIQLTDITTDKRRPLVCQPLEQLDE